MFCYTKKLDLHGTCLIDKIKPLDGDVDEFFEAESQTISFVSDPNITMEETIGDLNFDCESPEQYCARKLKLISTNEHVMLCLQNPTPDGKNSRLVLTKRRDGLHYLYRNDYRRDETGRMELISRTLIDRQRGVANFMIKNMGKSLLLGKNIMSLSLPVTIFEPRSVLQRYHIFGMAPHFLEKASRIQNNPLERMKLIVAYVVSRSHLFLEQQKPFNPILGETYQGFVDGCPVFVEQISHHPPAQAYQFLGRGYNIEGTSEGVFKAGISGGGHGLISFKGIEKIGFPGNGGTILIRWPNVLTDGLLFGTRTGKIVSKAIIYDQKNCLYSHIKFDPDDGILNIFSSENRSHDSFTGYICTANHEFVSKLQAEMQQKKRYKLKPGKGLSAPVSKISGTTLKSLVIDDKEYWHIDKIIPYRLFESESPLPSDSTYREDILQLLSGDFDKAQVAKEQMEEAQRRDRKLRAVTKN